MTHPFSTVICTCEESYRGDSSAVSVGAAVNKMAAFCLKGHPLKGKSQVLHTRDSSHWGKHSGAVSTFPYRMVCSALVTAEFFVLPIKHVRWRAQGTGWCQWQQHQQQKSSPQLSNHLATASSTFQSLVSSVTSLQAVVTEVNKEGGV